MRFMRFLRLLGELDEIADTTSEVGEIATVESQEIQEVLSVWHDQDTTISLPFTKRFYGHELLNTNNPIDYFHLFFTNEFMELIVKESNNYAETIFMKTGTRENSRITRWKPLDVKELKIFLGLMFHMGNIKTARITDYWKQGPLFRLGFGEYMSRNRFTLILRCIHFAKNPVPGEPPVEDRLFKIRPLITHFNNSMKLLLYYPGKNMRIDKSVMLWRGRLYFRYT